MELYQLRTFVAVAEEGNFTRAGKRVHATQPAVSAHIKALEEELGVKLFVRAPRGVALTQAGDELVQEAIEVLEAVSTLRARAVTLGGEVAGAVSLGLCAEPDYLRVTDLMNAISDRFPKLNLNLTQSPSGAIISGIRDHSLDAGFIFAGNPYGDLTTITLGRPEYSVLGAVQMKDELASATGEDLSRYTWVMPTSNCPFREIQLRIFREHNITPVRTIGADSEEVIKPLITKGKALALVRGDDVQAMLNAGEAAECMSLGRHPVELNFVYRTNEEATPSMSALIEIVRDLWKV